ncbi:hypothetical protein LTR10_015038 [Elasticomyces elasticus]|uniref:Peroxisomal membrane protein PEX17 n=1 Tax=Exophiala sideris TaxID=1016849 RepID=A0ABR0JQP7_9EURO|nr:hypothetical protein LTR10_015038 [Elasticomyces elasticus]KAK5039914.1 hypothetical protein LTS07_000409 [Exophiala sideris]KAK5068293.1 hypothetical protein LTR69_000411 [Exophiala sideris]KAK5187594.1 hypothetical protein LTR44_000410 [Eurotiomycetes sp. CCFEE 6388]
MDRSLAALLRSLQTSEFPADALRLLPTATNLLSRLSNPLNVTLLTSHLLSNDILHPRPIEITQSRQIFSVFYTAVLRLIEDKQSPAHAQLRSDLPVREWVKAIVKGADERSPRWRHTLLIGGLLLAFQSRKFEELPSDLRNKLEAALVTASNLALLQKDSEPNCELPVIFVLNHTFPLLSDYHRSQVQFDLLLPILVNATFFSREGLEQGYWLGAIDNDVRQFSGQKFNWSTRSKSFSKINEIKSRSLVAPLGALSRLMAHCIDNVQDGSLIVYSTNRIAEFARTLATSWRQNKLSEVDPREEAQYLDQETINQTLPVLLQLLRNTVFAAVITLRSVVGRTLCDSTLASNNTAPSLAMQTLHILRDTYFIAHRFGLTSSSQYTFVNFTANDILSRYQAQSEHFLEAIKPGELGRIPLHPLDRTYDLFFLNTAEHFTLTLLPRTNQELLFNSAAPYVDPRGDPRLGEIFEAAHSVMLAILAAPQNAEVATRNVPFYVETLLQSFPKPLTARQFRFAMKSVIRLAAPPSPIAMSMPLMQAIVLDLLRERVEHASEDLLPPNPDVPVESDQPSSERTVLLLSIIDCLSSLPILLLEDWLPVTADLLQKVKNPAQKQQCQQRLWNALSDGEMDVERAASCVAWWTSRGGREHVTFGEQPEDQEYLMSGALQFDNKL